MKEPPDSSDLSRMTLDGLEEEQHIHSAENKSWDDAFQHFFRHTQKPVSVSASHLDLLCATLLQIRLIALSIRLAGVMSISELFYDRYLSEFKKIISLARPMVGNPQSFTEGSFCFDQEFVYELVLVAFSCRDSSPCRKVIELLGSKDWKEGTWGSRRVADGARHMVRTEEEGAETEYIPEYSRTRLVRIEVDVERRLAHIQCVWGIAPDTVLKSDVRDQSLFY